MKKLSKIEMKQVMGGLSLPPVCSTYCENTGLTIETLVPCSSSNPCAPIHGFVAHCQGLPASSNYC